ncbi:tRNA (N(6)-L-threonylcarbamoyladenosine(37)-C(2))-methylthiotransferase MtaB [Anaerocolumna aminovalerica]|uniref:Threonylcarbamoyladenosine tRNA methylthiotransferase MtaB n=1 Tax=Anaerocolumna aminovalerica TaxID=1527 RepID=A0A1I5CZ49_9FIRM|nr:tRNA (N(6)-L-threonylcarbamoyladenosine(37)-C(2))-methylthiotransferase MtaB [Anaerocolumna aminovalerica]MBU5331314.1 tRNA (N(6)-L-threonylcarbamoyladenosine(37)-C(2))-methylthiotransferase MtaB [Anaerocolumna aminovalerica]MDU6264346.1 tRNA (N(6)-L-threonylcarbamoyladenosine(37)-C(2))-methylthiotransferase MtaB [Anaerocolumna aminovalerica]SFN92238.1 threonylcarbamoyladenosine tRNA methylthiotransferase MtaB [Anaerocolumna aminovalerica]
MNNNHFDKNGKTVAFLTLGCKVNSYETEAMQKLFEDEDYQVVDFDSKADVYVVNTCTVTNIADRKSRQMLHRARKLNENATVIAVGCYVQAAKDVLEQDDAIDIVIGNNKKNKIIDILKEYNQGKNIEDEAVIDLSIEAKYEPLMIESVTEKVRAYIKIQDGCNQFCSYCIIPYARGRVRSRDEESIMEEVQNLVTKGYKEIVLTGIHLTSYGIDLDERKESKLLALIVNLSTIEGLERIRLGSLEPRIITEDFAKTLAVNKKFCPHFHLSLQSGSDETLKRMNRKYSPKEYFEKCELLRKYFDNPAITTDVIVGFPGETEEEFNETKQFLAKVAFAQMHVFKYSKRNGTRAYSMPDQVKEEIKAERSNILIDLNAKMMEDYHSSFIGKSERILVEEIIEIDGKQYQIGHNERYVKLAINAEKSLINQIVTVNVIKDLTKEIMFCEIMD